MNNRKRNVLGLACIILLLVLAGSVFLFINSDYVKSRKIVDMDWMIGKTMDEIARKYSYPSNPNYYDPYMPDPSPYVLCAREIFVHYPDAGDGQYLYYALLNGDGIVIDVYRSPFNGDMPPQDYSYWDRW